MTTPISLFCIGTQGNSVNVTAAHRLNVYYQVSKDADKTQVAAVGTPGLYLFGNVSSAKTRGLHWMESNNMLYAVQGQTLWEVTAFGTASARGQLNARDTLGVVSMANNGNAGNQLLIATGSFAYIYNIQTGLFSEITQQMPDYGVYGTGIAGTATFLDSFFIVNQPGTGQFWVSNSYDGTTWNALNFATAESNPDNLQAVWAVKGHLALLGTSSTEIWINTGAQAFPYQKVQGAESASGVSAVWSLSMANGNLTGLIRNKQGALAVAYLDGYVWTPISTPDLDYLINNYQAPSDAVGFGYTQNGRAFYQITFQTAQQSWLYDFATGAWSQLKSWGVTRHIADLGTAFAEKFIVSDYSTGILYQLSPNTYTDNGATIEREITGKHIFRPSRNMSKISRLRVEVEGGVGLLGAIDPSIMLQISRDNGHTWGSELWTTFGGQGEFSSRAEWRRLGQARDWVFKLRVTDPIKLVLIYAVIEMQELNK